LLLIQSKEAWDMANQGSAIIVGVGDGLGATLTRRFARAGHAVATVARDIDKLAPLIGEITGAGGVARAYAGDATADADVARIFDAAETELGPAEVVIYNVGARVIGPIVEQDTEEFVSVWRNACLGAMIVGREAARRMAPRGCGSILFTGGRTSRRAGAEQAAFAVGKFGLRALAQSMAHELAPQGIHVSHFIIEGRIDNAGSRQWARDKVLPEDGLIDTEALAELYWQTHVQPRSCWTFETDLRPWAEPF